MHLTCGKACTRRFCKESLMAAMCVAVASCSCVTSSAAAPSPTMPRTFSVPALLPASCTTHSQSLRTVCGMLSGCITEHSLSQGTFCPGSPARLLHIVKGKVACCSRVSRSHVLPAIPPSVSAPDLVLLSADCTPQPQAVLVTCRNRECASPPL